ncbi:major facilitator superfamily permease [Paramagnetospirillum caucaseum]|uniref:Major facilitator superfamily permease n=1 Tax=Paramagnetospirillum caucaseum TaxID=1244869 RepID=M2Z3R8_9PROT|nr:MFS transporter [Paramagnetospirillum caucaseum]EME69015.1 major facilitator superfamily permease [Paramagnetospirillum caucaseum]
MPDPSEHPLVRRLPFHYGWAVVAAGSVGIFACLGLGRFALGMLLPSMGLSLELSRSEMGWISTGNFVGYMAAVLLGGRMVGRWGARRTVVGGLVLVGLSMMAVSRAEGFAQVLLLYLLTGFGSGSANVPVMGLIAHWFGRRVRGRAAGFVVIGSGVAIMTAGALVPAINAAYGAEGWRLSWLVIGLMVLGAAAIDLLVLRDTPSELGLSPVTGAPAAGPGAPAPVCAAAPSPAAKRRILAHLGAVYAAFGFTYVIYATFIVIALVQERGFPESTAGMFWSWIGFLSLASGPVFGGLSDRIGRRAGLMIVFAFQTTAYVLVALPLPEPFLYASIALFGLVVWAIPSIMAAAVGDYLGPEQAAAAFGTITMVFALGQIVGPAVAGWMADFWGGFSGAFAMAAAVAGLGLAGSAFLPNPRKP